MIDFNKTRQYTLSIRLSTDGFCFAVHNPEAEEQYAYLPYPIDPAKSLTANLKDAVEKTDMLRHTYGHVNVTVAEARYTIVPKEYYAEQYVSEFYRQNFGTIPPNTTALHNPVGDGQAMILFAVETRLYEYIGRQYPKAHISASISTLMDFGIEKSEATGKKYCMVHLYKRKMDLLCFDNGLPIFTNTFTYQDTSDALFFLLNCWTTLGLSQTDDTIHIAGQPRHSKALAKELANFVQHIHIIRPAEEFHSTELARIDDMPFDLQALIACE